MDKKWIKIYILCKEFAVVWQKQNFTEKFVVQLRDMSLGTGMGFKWYGGTEHGEENKFLVAFYIKNQSCQRYWKKKQPLSMIRDNSLEQKVAGTYTILCGRQGATAPEGIRQPMANGRRFLATF
jgi:hypothetical protein